MTTFKEVLRGWQDSARPRVTAPRTTRDRLRALAKDWNDFHSAFFPTSAVIPIQSMDDYKKQYTDKPYVVKLTYVGSGKTMSLLHVSGSYDGIAVESSGNVADNCNKGKEDRKRKWLDEEVFLLSPAKMGVNATVLKNEMQKERDKEFDYNLIGNNCVDHVIRPVQRAAVPMAIKKLFDLGDMATPKELHQVCEKLCQQGMGIRISDTELPKIPQLNKDMEVIQKGAQEKAIARRQQGVRLNIR